MIRIVLGICYCVQSVRLISGLGCLLCKERSVGILVNGLGLDVIYCYLLLSAFSERFSRIGAVAYFCVCKSATEQHRQRRRSGLVRHRHVPGATLAASQGARQRSC